MTFAAIYSILGWVLPLVKVGVSALTKSNLPQNIIDDLQAAADSIEKVIAIDEPTRAQVYALDIDPAAWGTVGKLPPGSTTGLPPVAGS